MLRLFLEDKLVDFLLKLILDLSFMLFIDCKLGRGGQLPILSFQFRNLLFIVVLLDVIEDHQTERKGVQDV